MAFEVDLGDAFRRVYLLTEKAGEGGENAEAAETIEIRLLRLSSPSTGKFQGVFTVQTSEGLVLQRHANGADGIQALILTLEIVAIHIMKICSDRGRSPMWSGVLGPGLHTATRTVTSSHLVQDLPEELRLNLVPVAKLSPYCRREFDVITPGQTTPETGCLEFLETGKVREDTIGIDAKHYCTFRFQWPGQSEDEYVVYGVDGFEALCNMLDAIDSLARQYSQRFQATVERYGMPGLHLQVRDLWDRHGA
jgi:hypothetical protein